MRVTMLASISGTRDGVDWPAKGETLDVPADEAASLIDAGLATAGAPMEAADAEPPAENAALTTKAAPRRKG